ncbi:MAG: TolC family protein [Balneolaceae bacterium]|nr:TolC family protein [Balneolaceae bacterium]
MNNHRTFSLFTLFILLAVGGPAVAQQNQQGGDLGTLTLQQAIGIAQDQSPQAETARFALLANQWQYRSYRADLLPSLTLSGQAPNFNRSINPVTQPDGSVVFRAQVQSEASTELFIQQNIPQTGGSLFLQSGLERLGIFGGESTYLWSSSPLVARFSQPLFQYNSFRWQQRIQPLQYEIAQKEYAQNMESIAQQVTNRFFSVYLNRINLENAEFNVTRNDSIYNISQGRYEVGSISENELLQTELQLSNSQSNLTSARIEYERSLNDFKIFLGYPTSVTFDLDPPTELPEINVTLDRAVQLAMENNSEALDYELQELQADANFAQAKSESNFQFDINATYGINQTAENFVDLYDNPQNRQSVNVSFQVPIFNWGKQRAEVQMARNQQQQTQSQIQYQRRQFIQEIEYTVKQFMQLAGQVDRAARSDTIAQRRYEVAQNRYLIGSISITDLFIAQSDRTSARQSYIGALQDFWSGWYNLRQLTLWDFRRNEPIDHQL